MQLPEKEMNILTSRSMASVFVSNTITIFFFILLTSFHFTKICRAQQPYINNKQLDCYNKHNSTLGFICNGARKSCTSYVIFRSNPPYNVPSQIAFLLNSNPSEIARINGISDVDVIPTDTLVVVPVDCSCPGKFYQHNSFYILKDEEETYFTVSNNTYQGLTTCQAMMDQNSYESRNLVVSMNLSVPIRCACPSKSQALKGVRFLLTYLITWGDNTSKISDRFKVDETSLLEANDLSPQSTIYPFNTLLIPLKTEPNRAVITDESPSPSASAPQTPALIQTTRRKSHKKVIIIGVGTGCGLIVLFAILICFFYHGREKAVSEKGQVFSPSETGELLKNDRPVSMLPEEIGDTIGSLPFYNFDVLKRATNSFREDNLIKGSVYRGVINGDTAAIKRMKGDVSSEIKILKQVNHSNVIRLSGFCLHKGNSYLVYEFAENGSLSDWLHDWKSLHSSSLTWKQRVQIAFDVAEGMNYLHNYASPSYIHKDLKSSNILLGVGFRAKVSNFQLARSTENEEHGVQLTRHVVGTQGYMPPEYLEHGWITSKLDVFSMGVVLLEILSGKEAVIPSEGDDEKGRDKFLSECIKPVMEGEKVREKLKEFMDASLKDEYPLESAFFVAELAVKCVAHDPNFRPTMMEVYMALSDIHASLQM